MRKQSDPAKAVVFATTKSLDDKINYLCTNFPGNTVAVYTTNEDAKPNYWLVRVQSSPTVRRVDAGNDTGAIRNDLVVV